MKSYLLFIKENVIATFSIAVVFIIIFMLSLHLENNFNNEKKNAKVTEKIDFWLGKKMFLPHYDSLDKSYSLKNKGIKIVSYIDGNCGKCIEEVFKWKQLTTKNKVFDKVDIIFFINSMDFESLISFIEFKEPFPLPLINDKENVFFSRNGLADNKMFQTFMLDQNNNVLIVGNPMLGDKILQLYIRTIQELNED
jgi:hypothetical protein